MNVLLFAPAYALIYMAEVGILRSIGYGTIAIMVQIILALPFLTVNSTSYVQKAFEFSRQFLHVWTVNWKFLDKSIFNSSNFAVSLVVVHFVLVVLFLAKIVKENNITISFHGAIKRLDTDGNSIINQSGALCVVWS